MHKKKNKKLLIIIVVVSLLAIAVIAWFFLKPNTITAPSTLPKSQEDNYVDDGNQPLTDGKPGTEDKVITPTTPPSSESGNIEKPTITRAEQNGDFIRISVVLTDASSGTCVVSLSKSGESTLEKSARIVVGPSYYTCDGFRIPRSELGASGEWQVVVSHTYNDQRSDSDKKTITIR